MKNLALINSVVNSNKIETVFNHIGTPAWTSETWERQNDGHFKCTKKRHQITILMQVVKLRLMTIW